MKPNWINIKSYLGNFGSLLAVIIASFSLWISVNSYYYETELENRRFIIDVMREMKGTQSELKKIRSKISGKDNLSENEILLLNYYEILSRVLADKIDDEPTLFTWAQCQHVNSVRLRKRPSRRSVQIGGIANTEWVVVLGEFSYTEEDIWYFVISPNDKKIGWAYKYFKISE